MRFAISTLGCKVNQYESQLIREAFRNSGSQEQEFSLPGADVYIINTCTVTHRSDADARKLIRRASCFNARLIVTGCQATVYPGDIRGISDRAEIVPFEEMGAALGLPIPAHITGFSGHSRAFVNVQQGCSNNCTYCIVPKARGIPRSRDTVEILREIEDLYGAGYREIILTGINIGLYEGGIEALLEKILAKSAMPGIRISSVEPWTVSEHLIDLVANEERLCKHLHLPLQSGSDRILSLMGRPYDAGYYRDLVGRVRSASPDIAIGSDVMVGFPGEGQSEFDETFSLLNSLDISYLHVFPFSPRPGTPAAGFPGQVDSLSLKARAADIRKISQAKKKAFIRSLVGRETEVLVTHSDETGFKGVSSNYIKVEVPGKATLNEHVRVVIEEAFEAGARGRLNG